MAKPGLVGTASVSVSVGLALLLIVLIQRPDSETARKQPPPPAIVKTANQTALPAQAAVVLPPPPAPPKPRSSQAKAPQPKPVPPAVQRQKTPPKTKPPVKLAAKPAVKPPPPPKPSVPPRRSPKARAAPKKPIPAPAAKRTIAAVAVTRETVAEGRALLRMLEVGKGPTIEIAWPATPAKRDRLYAVLKRCYGLRTALMTGDGRIYLESGRAGAPTRINRDRTSGFMRSPTGAIPAAERRLIARIQRHHRQAGLTPVRLFPRHVDAVLLSGIRQIVGRDYGSLQSVRARYVSNGGSVSISDITADSDRRNGQIKLPRVGFRRC